MQTLREKEREGGRERGPEILAQKESPREREGEKDD